MEGGGQLVSRPVRLQEGKKTASQRERKRWQLAWFWPSALWGVWQSTGFAASDDVRRQQMLRIPTLQLFLLSRNYCRRSRKRVYLSSDFLTSLYALKSRSPILPTSNRRRCQPSWFPGWIPWQSEQSKPWIRSETEANNGGDDPPWSVIHYTSCHHLARRGSHLLRLIYSDLHPASKSGQKTSAKD